MASIRSDKGWLFLGFNHRGERYREYLNLRDTRDGRCGGRAHQERC